MAGQVREWKSALGRGKNKSFWFYVFFTFDSELSESMAPTIYILCIWICTYCCTYFGGVPQVRIRCRKEWGIFQTRLADAEKKYYLDQGITPPNSTSV
jgi:hypothetical protein